VRCSKRTEHEKTWGQREQAVPFSSSSRWTSAPTGFEVIAMLPYPGVGVGVVFFWEVVPGRSVVDAHLADKSARTSRQMRGALYHTNSILAFS
jgi:hypothetical protein